MNRMILFLKYLFELENVLNSIDIFTIDKCNVWTLTVSTTE